MSDIADAVHELREFLDRCCGEVREDKVATAHRNLETLAATIRRLESGRASTIEECAKVVREKTKA